MYYYTRISWYLVQHHPSYNNCQIDTLLTMITKLQHVIHRL